MRKREKKIIINYDSLNFTTEEENRQEIPRAKIIIKAVPAGENPRYALMKRLKIGYIRASTIYDMCQEETK